MDMWVGNEERLAQQESGASLSKSRCFWEARLLYKVYIN